MYIHTYNHSGNAEMLDTDCDVIVCKHIQIFFGHKAAQTPAQTPAFEQSKPAATAVEAVAAAAASASAQSHHPVPPKVRGKCMFNHNPRLTKHIAYADIAGNCHHIETTYVNTERQRKPAQLGTWSA